MADKMDALLTALGQEANEQVDFDGAFAQILAQHQQQEAQAAPQPRRRWRAWRGTLSMAAGMVVVLGTVLLVGRSGLFNAKGAAPEAAAPAEASMYAADAEAEMDVTAEAPAAEIPAAEAPAEAAVSPSVAAIPRDAQPEAETGSSAGGAGQEESAEAAQATSEEAPVAVQVPKTDGVQIQDPDGNQLEAGRKKLSETPAQTALQRLQDAGYPARLVDEVDASADLPIGYAYYALDGGLGIWNTGDGYVYLYDPTLDADALLAAFQAAVNP